MAEYTTIILILALIGVFIFYLITFHPFRSGVKQTIVIPKRTVEKLKASRHQKNEVLLKLDYEQGKELPTRQVLRSGSSGAVRPGLINTEEVIIHTHPPVKNKDIITNAYETKLRERPSLADLKFSKAKKGPELLMTPSGKLIEFNAEQAELSKLKNIEKNAQLQAAKEIPPNNKNSATKSASLANKIFFRESRNAGVTYKEFDTNKKIKLKTKVK